MSLPTRKRRLFRPAPVNAGLVVVLVSIACAGGLAGGALLMRFGQAPAILAPAATASATLPPTLTPSPTAPPTATRTATPVPPARVAVADALLFDGDWQRAAAEYQAALNQSNDPALVSAAQLGLAKARLYDGNAAGAVAGLNAYLASNDNQDGNAAHTADAHFLLGDAYSASGEWAAAAQAYNAYLNLRPNQIDSYAQEAIASAAMRLGDYTTAATALEAAIAAGRQGGHFDLRERLGGVYAAAGDIEAALAQYQQVFDESNENWRKARMDVLAGQLLHQNGRSEEAHAEFLHALNNYPESPITFEGLVILVNDGVTVDELQRGLCNYYADSYGSALAAFERYRTARAADDTATSSVGDATALFFIGQTHQASGQTAQAIAAWRELVDTYPGSSYWSRAYMQIAFAQPYPDDVETFVAFATAAPEAPEAPDALFRAARLSERNRDFAGAAELWTRIAEDFPNSAQAADAAMQAGLVFYRQGQFGSAAQRFELASTLGSDTSEHARAWLWLGKVKQQQGNTTGARADFVRAAAYGPHGYYPLRAAQLARGEEPFDPPAGYSFDFDVETEKAQVDAWLRATFPAAQALERPSELQPGVYQQPTFVRGAELWRLGRTREAHAEFNRLRLDLSGDPLAMWQLALYFNHIGAYDLGIRSARTVVDLAGYPDTLLAPKYILRLRYPAPFSERVVEAAGRYNLHPFLMYSKMRIESFFWKYAFSVADARGLNQIIPTTANDIASQLGMTDFEQEDLFRPAVVIPMGAYYLDFIARITGDNPPVLLAGYYAGPGNAQAWLDLSQDDYDLFVEVIRLPDAKGYVQTTFEFFEEYRELYGGE